MYRFMFHKCQEKNEATVEKRATTLERGIEFRFTGSDQVARLEQSQGQAGNQIVPAMRKHARAQTAAIERQQAEEHAEDSEQSYVAHALIRMRSADDHRGDRKS